MTGGGTSPQDMSPGLVDAGRASDGQKDLVQPSVHEMDVSDLTCKSAIDLSDAD